MGMTLVAIGSHAGVKGLEKPGAVRMDKDVEEVTFLSCKKELEVPDIDYPCLKSPHEE